MNIQTFRQKFPQYNDLSDDNLVQALHKKHYSDMDLNAFKFAFLGSAQPARNQVQAPVASQPNKFVQFAKQAAPIIAGMGPGGANIARALPRDIQQNLGQGAIQGLQDMVGGVAQTGSALLEKPGVLPGGTTQSLSDWIKADREAFSALPASEATSGKIGRFAGEIAPWMALGGGGGTVGAGLKGVAKLAGKSGLFGGGIGLLQYADVVPEEGQEYVDALLKQKLAGAMRGGLFGSAIGGGLGGLLAIPQHMTQKFIQRIKSLPEVMSALKAGQRHKVPVFTSDVAKPSVNKLGELLEYAPVGMVNKRLAQNKAARLAAERVTKSSQKELTAAQFGGRTGLKRLREAAATDGPRAKASQKLLNDIKNTGDEWNQVIQTSGNVKLTRAKLIADRKYDKVRELADKAGKFSAKEKAGSIAAIREGMEEAAKSPIPKKDITRDLQQIKEYIDSPDVNYSGMMRAMSDLGDLVGTYKRGANAAVGKKGIGMLQKAKNAVERDMESFALTHGPKLRASQQSAAGFYKRNVVPATNRQIAKMLKTDRPDEIYQQFIKASIREDGRGRGAALQLYNALDDKGKAAVRYGMVSEALNKGVTRIKSGQDIVLSPAKFANSLEKIAAAKKVFFKGAAKREIDGFINLIRTVRRSGQVAENPPTGHRLLQAMVATGGAGLSVTNPVGAAATTGGLYGLQRLLTKDAGRRLLAASSRVSPGSKAAEKMIDRVIRFLTISAAKAGAE